MNDFASVGFVSLASFLSTELVAWTALFCSVVAFEGENVLSSSVHYGGICDFCHLVYQSYERKVLPSWSVWIPLNITNQIS